MQQISSTHTHTKKKNYSNTHYNSTNSMKKIKTLKVARVWKTETLYTEEQRWEWQQTSCQKQCNSGGSGATTFLKLGFYAQQKPFKHKDSKIFLNKEGLLLLLLLLLSHFSRVRLCATPQTAAHQAPPSLGFSRQEHWSGLLFPSPMNESEKWKWSLSVVSDS